MVLGGGVGTGGARLVVVPRRVLVIPSVILSRFLFLFMIRAVHINSTELHTISSCIVQPSSLRPTSVQRSVVRKNCCFSPKMQKEDKSEHQDRRPEKLGPYGRLTEEQFRATQQIERDKLRARRQEAKEQLSVFSVDDREEQVAIHTVRRKTENSVKCKKCWVPQQFCMCERMPKLHVPHRFLLYMHFKEYFNACNTGKILLSSSPYSELFLLAMKEDEKKLCDRIRTDLKNTIVLYPSPDSVLVSDFLVARKGSPDPLNIVVLDGTWNQAKHLHNRLANTLLEGVPLQKVRLSPTSPSLFMSRKQSQMDRICTIEAVALLLRELGEPATVSDTLADALKMIGDTAVRTGRRLNPVAEFDANGVRVDKKALRKRAQLARDATDRESTPGAETSSDEDAAESEASSRQTLKSGASQPSDDSRGKH